MREKENIKSKGRVRKETSRMRQGIENAKEQ